MAWCRLGFGSFSLSSTEHFELKTKKKPFAFDQAELAAAQRQRERSERKRTEEAEAAEAAAVESAAAIKDLEEDRNRWESEARAAVS